MSEHDRSTALVVNDDPVQLHLTTSVLEQDGMRVIACSSAEDALRTLNEHVSVHVIITDLHMPNIDGWRFCRLLRSPAYKSCNRIPILVVSATFFGIDAEQITADLGANAFLPIPHPPATLRACVRKLLRGEAPAATLGVLLVEDSKPQAAVLRTALEARGWMVFLAGTVAQARRLYRELEPEIVILDFHLPDGTAIDLLGDVKPAGSSTVAIVVSADPNPSRALECMRQRADGYVPKPFDPEYLITLCERARRERSFLRVEELLEERTREKARLVDLLRQAQKMEAIGTLAGGVAHDFNNLLTVILGHTHLLKLRARPDDPVHKAMSVIETTVQRARQLTDQLLGFARGGKHRNVRFDIHATIHEVFQLLDRTIVNKNFICQEDFHAARAGIMGDPGQLHQVILNLALNARDAMPDGGVLSCTTQVVPVSAAAGQRFPGMAVPEYLKISIADTGCGIPEDIQGRIFEPFFTTKGPDKGSGMGLAMVYTIVQNHGGFIEVESVVGEGATFHLYLPLSDAAPRAGSPNEPMPSGLLSTGGGTTVGVPNRDGL